MILLIDFDERADRLDQVRAVMPSRLSNHVFILGVWSEPEDLTQDYDATGRRLAEDCRSGTLEAWGQELLKHNAPEVKRLRELVGHILF